MPRPPEETHRGTGSWSGTRRSFPNRVARRIIARDRECMLRWSPDCTGLAEEADHVVSHAEAQLAGWDPTDIDDPANGQGVCRACHRIKTNAEATRGRARAAARRPKRQRPTEPHPGLS